jgi:hypothetical protein
MLLARLPLSARAPQVKTGLPTPSQIYVQCARSRYENLLTDQILTMIPREHLKAERIGFITASCCG